jgi:hypothetical protein
MVAPLRTASIAAPGFFGLNTMDSEVTLNQNYARSAENCIIDEGGRLGSRLGWTYVAQTATPATPVNLKGMHRFLDINGQEYFGAWSDTAFYIKNAGDLDSVTYNGSQTITAGNWQAATLNDAAFLFQRDYSPLYFSPTANVVDDVTNATNHAIVTVSNGNEVSIINGVEISVGNSTTVTITHSGTVATVNQVNHYFSTGDEVIIDGANETEYNGTFTITVVDADSYTYTLPSSPSKDATGSITSLGVIAKVFVEDHGLTTGDSIVVSGANLSEYNGTFTVTVVDDNNFYYDMGSTPNANPEGTIIGRSVTAFVTQASHGFSTGDSITITGSTETAYNGVFTITVLNDNVYSYSMASVPTTDATGTPVARTDLAVVTSADHELYTGNSVTISDSGVAAYNGTFTVTKIDSNSYSYVLASVPTTDATGSITATWDKGTPPEANTVLSAYGRIWCADTPTNKTTVYWSDLLDGTEWRSGVGTVGTLDISGILVNGNDEIVGLGAHNGYLIIFCKNNIVIMGDGDAQKQYLTPANMSLVEVINGVGCISRDSIVNTGTDILFLSESGVRSLGRTIQEKSQPVRDISRNVRDTLVDQVSRADETQIRAVYSDHFAFYLLAIPDEQTVWCFDMRAPLQNGSARVTRWNGLTHTSWLAFDGAMYMTNTQGIAEYKGFQDNGSKYSMQYYTNYFDFGMSNMVKIVKNIAATVIGSTGQKFVAKIGTDYEDIYTSYNLTVKDAEVSEYNIAEYNIGEYSGAALIDNIRIPAGGSGFVIQVGFESEINGGFLNIQQIDLYVKQGRLN